MSNVLMCDSCGTVRSKTAARPEGWVSLRTLVALGHVVPETHPFHHERHLCSVECLQEFIQVAVDGGILPVDADVVQLPSRSEVGREVVKAAPDSRALSGGRTPDEPTSDTGKVSASTPRSADAGDTERAAAGAERVGAGATQSHASEAADTTAPVTRLSDLIAQKLARGDGDRVDLREIAAKPAVKRRIR